MELGSLDHRGLGELLKGPEMVALTAEGARRGLEWAREHAQVGHEPNDPHPGEFRASIHVVEDAKSAKGDRAAALLVADSDDAVAVEFGNRHRKGSHVLAEAAKVIEGL